MAWLPTEKKSYNELIAPFVCLLGQGALQLVIEGGCGVGILGF